MALTGFLTPPSDISDSCSANGIPQHGGNRGWAAAQVGLNSEQILDFSASLNPWGPPISVLQALSQAVANPLQAVGSYPDPESELLRLELARKHGIPIDWIRVGNGAAEWITWAARDSAELSQTLLPVPAFGDYERALSALGASIRRIRIPFEQASLWPLEQWLGPAVDAAMAVSTANRSALWLNNPHNPTGILWQPQDLLPYLRAFDLVVVDEAFMDFLPLGSQGEESNSLIPWVADYPQLVVIRSLTKFYTIPGLRLGYVIAHPDRLRRWQTWRDPWSVNGLAQVAGIAALQDHAFQSHTHQWLAPARQHLESGLREHLPGWDPLPSAANFLLCRIPGSATQIQAEWLRHKGILIRDCSSFPELGHHYIRLGVRTGPEHERLWGDPTSFITG